MNDTTPRGIRWTIRLLSVVLFSLFLYLEGFVLGDLDQIEGPDLGSFQQQHRDAALIERVSALELRTSKIDVERQRQEEIKTNRSQAKSAAQGTWSQVQDEHRYEVERGREPSAELQETLAKAITRFMAAESAYEEANSKLAELNAQRYALQAELAQARNTLQPQEDAAYEAFREAVSGHRFLVASYKLVFIVPLFLLSAWLLAKKRGAMYGPILRALMVASFLTLGWVMFEHFPSEYFKYIAIGSAVAIVLTFLVKSLRTAHQPRPDLLLKQRREAYHIGSCPECAYPFPDDHGHSFTCPSCGTGLFAACGSCSESRHSLLPFCVHCGAPA